MASTPEPEYAPAFSLTAEGRDITRTLRQCLAELTLTDNGGATGRADDLKIIIISETLQLPPKGARLRLALGFNEHLTDKGWFVVSGVSSSGPPRRVEIYATAAPMNSEKHPGNVVSQKTRSWDDITLGDIVRTVAADNGLKARVAASLVGKRIDHIDQVSESDANFLSRLARNWNAVSKPSGGYWLFTEQGASENISGKSSPVITITPEEVSRWSYSEGERSAASKSKEDGKISVRYFDEADGRTKKASVDHNGGTLENPYTQSSQEQAEQQAKSKKTQASRNERKMNLSGPCRPKHIPLSAECGVKTSGFGVREDRQWVVESLEYTLSSSGFTYNYSLVVDIKNKSSEKSQDKKGPDYFG